MRLVAVESCSVLFVAEAARASAPPTISTDLLGDLGLAGLVGLPGQVADELVRRCRSPPSSRAGGRPTPTPRTSSSAENMPRADVLAAAARRAASRRRARTRTAAAARRARRGRRTRPPAAPSAAPAASCVIMDSNWVETRWISSTPGRRRRSGRPSPRGTRRSMRVGRVSALTYCGLLGEAGPRLLHLATPERVVVHALAPDHVEHRLLALGAQQRQQLLGLLEHVGVVAAAQATVAGDDAGRRPASGSPAR